MSPISNVAGGISCMIDEVQLLTPFRILRHLSSRCGINKSFSSIAKFSIVAPSRTLINSGTHSIGKSRNHGLCGGGKEVLNFSDTALACSQFGCKVTKNLCQCNRTLNLRLASENCSLVKPGMPLGQSVFDNPIIERKSSTVSGEFNSSMRSLAHQSIEYPAGTKFLLFSMNSP